MIDLKHVVTFLAIAQQNSFSRAAEALDIAQPTVSVHVKRLEKSLGYDLFDRVGKYAVMTTAGKQFRETAQELVELAMRAELIGSAEKKLSGSITVCIVQSICVHRMPAILKQFNQRYPDVHVNIVVSRPSIYMLEPLRRGEFDAAIVLEAPFDIPTLSSRALWRDTMRLIAAPSHPLSRLQTVSFEMLKHETFIMQQKGAYTRKLFERRVAEAGVVLNEAFEIHNMEAIKRCVMEGVGLAMLPGFAVEAEIGSGQLAELALEGRKLNMTAQLIWHKDRVLGAPASTFVDYVIHQFGR
ncbi:MAG: LysR family transcriptional regulator [Candidatus Promineifilaceae bacterium]